MVVERATEVCRVNGRTSMIVPLSFGFSEDFSVLRHIYMNSAGTFGSLLRSNSRSSLQFRYSRPQSIYLAKRSSETSPRRVTTRLHRWFDSERQFLFDNLYYCQFSPSLFGGLVPKLGNARLMQGFEALLSSGDYRLGSDLSRFE